MPSVRLSRSFPPPLCPAAPPLERGEGPNSGPDWRESVGWMIRLLPPNGLAGSGPSGRKGRDSGPCISSRCGLCTLEPLLPLRLAFIAVDAALFFIALAGRLAASPYFLAPA